VALSNESASCSSRIEGLEHIDTAGTRPVARQKKDQGSVITASDIEDPCVLEVAQFSIGQSRLQSQEDVLEIVAGSYGWIRPDPETGGE
jgi:hypothetical protein